MVFIFSTKIHLMNTISYNKYRATVRLNDNRHVVVIADHPSHAAPLDRTTYVAAVRFRTIRELAPPVRGVFARDLLVKYMSPIDQLRLAMRRQLVLEIVYRCALVTTTRSCNTQNHTGISLLQRDFSLD